MPYSWEGKTGPQIGLQKQSLPYGHLHQLRRGHSSNQSQDVQKTRESSAEFAEIHAAPKSDSSHKSSSPNDSPVSEPDVAPPPRRRKLDGGLTSPTPPKKERDSSDIPRTRFTSSKPSLSHPNGRGTNRLFSSQSSQNAENPDQEVLFSEYHASQSKKSKRYVSKNRTVNFHKSAPTKAEKKIAKELVTAGSIVDVLSSGFKVADTEKICKMIPTPERKDFKRPAGLSPDSGSKQSSRRTSQEEIHGRRPPRNKACPKSPKSPTSPKQRTLAKQFIFPKGLSPNLEDRHPNRSNQSSQDSLMPDAPMLEALQGVSGFANIVSDTVNAVGTKLKVEFNAPTSSATISSAPEFTFEMGDGSSSSSLSSAPDVRELDALEFDDGWLETHPSSSPKSQCPLCKAFVSRSFIESFSGSGVLKLRQQVKFCKAHKMRSAQKLWRKKRYPDIDWDQFTKRLPMYEDALVEILNGTRRSFYRNAFEDQVKSGVNRTLQQSWMSGSGWQGLNMGYYGTKGARILMDYTMLKFASRIRKRGGSDPLVSAGGVAGFVQAVLAPELAVMLVRDDMSVDEERARVILSESSEIGNLLNEEEDELIRDAAEKDAEALE